MITKAQYRKLLKHNSWLNYRRKVYQRDKHTCVQCGKGKTEVHCHHLYYIDGKKPWQYPLSACVTLCKACHTKIHKNGK